MLAGRVLISVSELLDLLKNHPPIPCGDKLSHQDGAMPMVESTLGMIDRDFSRTADAAVFECRCGWRRTVRLVPNVKA